MIMTLYLAHGTDKAWFFMFLQRQSPEMKAGQDLGVWIPKKCCTILEKDPHETWHWTRCKVKVTTWFAKQSSIAQRQEHVVKHYVKDEDTKDMIL
jgi:hypothetical protein